MSGSRFSIVAAFLHERLDMSDNPYESFLKAKEAALTAELAAVRAALSDIARLTGQAQVQSPAPAAPEPKPSKRKTANLFEGLTVSDAIVEVLGDGSLPKSPSQIWAELMRGGVEVSSEDPIKAISWSLRKRARKQKDVVHVAHGKWNLRSRYTDAQVRKMAKSNTGTGGLSRDDHSQRTRDGIEKHRAAGGRIGQPLKMTPERMLEVENLLRSGEGVSSIARHLKMSPQTIYSRYKKADIVRLRAEGAAEWNKDGGERPNLRLVT